jgi:hypothetical protein
MSLNGTLKEKTIEYHNYLGRGDESDVRVRFDQHRSCGTSPQRAKIRAVREPTEGTETTCTVLTHELMVGIDHVELA